MYDVSEIEMNDNRFQNAANCRSNDHKCFQYSKFTINEFFEDQISNNNKMIRLRCQNIYSNF